MFEVDLATCLGANPGLIAVAGDRIYVEVLPQFPTLPALVYHEVSSVPNYSHEGDSLLDESIYQFTCWGETPLAAKQVAAAVRALLPSKQYWQAAFIENKFARADQETHLHREIIMVRFQHRSS